MIDQLAREDAYQRLLWPRSVAVIGASDDPNKVGGRPLQFMRRFGFSGQILPINPGRSQVQGLKAYPDLEALDGAPDVAIIAVAGDSAMQSVQSCAALGIGTAIVMASGFGELGVEGQEAQRKMAAFALKGNMRLVGPNAQGIANFANGAVLNFSTMFTTVEPMDGPIAVISQSGAASVVPFAHLRAAGHGVRYVVASGNDVDLGVCELCRAIASDESIKLLLVYAETLNNPSMLAEAAQIAARRGASIVLVKAGRSQKGALAAQTHTGALLNNDAAIEAFTRRHGIWRVENLSELIRAVPIYLQGAEPGLGRTGIMTPSGAIGVLCADTAERIKLELADFSPKTIDALDKVLPSFATASNPLDLTAGLLGNASLFPRALECVADDPNTDMLMIGLTIAGPGYDIQGMVEQVARVATESGKPLAVAAPLSSTCELVRNAGLPAYQDESAALQSLLQYHQHRTLMAYANTNTNAAQSPEPVHLPVDVALPASAGVLDEFTSLQVLKEAGVNAYENRWCRSAQDAIAAFHELGGGPVVVKACAPGLPHKSEFDLVHLNLLTEESVSSAAQSCLAKLSRMNIPSGGVIVGVMAPSGGHEFALGLLHDPLFGHVLMVAEGGTLIELRRDSTSLLAPCTLKEATDAIRRLQIAPLLDGMRDRGALDEQALIEAIVRLSQFAAAAGPRLRSLDVNPLLVLPKGHGALALDAVIELQETPK